MVAVPRPIVRNGADSRNARPGADRCCEAPVALASGVTQLSITLLGNMTKPALAWASVFVDIGARFGRVKLG